ncbi:MAG: hypothetical protein ACJ8AD_20160, partial [Gemmatimonadaceae bacterium]
TMRVALSDEARVVATTNWAQFTRALTRSACGIVSSHRLDARAVDRLTLLARERPGAPLVVITQKDADSVRRLTSLRVHAIVWPSEVDDALRSVVEGACRGRLLAKLAQTLGRSERLPLRLRYALACACRCEPPIHSVGELALAAELDRRSLWRYWHEACRGASSPRLEDFLRWIVLLHAAALKRSGRQWSGVATDLGVHEHTLRRLARRLGGVTLRELSALGQPALIRRFCDDIIHPLVGESAWDELA